MKGSTGQEFLSTILFESPKTFFINITTVQWYRTKSSYKQSGGRFQVPTSAQRVKHNFEKVVSQKNEVPSKNKVNPINAKCTNVQLFGCFAKFKSVLKRSEYKTIQIGIPKINARILMHKKCKKAKIILNWTLCCKNSYQQMKCFPHFLYQFF